MVDRLDKSMVLLNRNELGSWRSRSGLCAQGAGKCTQGAGTVHKECVPYSRRGHSTEGAGVVLKKRTLHVRRSTVFKERILQSRSGCCTQGEGVDLKGRILYSWNTCCIQCTGPVLME